MGFAAQHIDAVYAADTPPAGIFGVGVVDLHNGMRPAVFVMLELMTAPVEMNPGTPGIQTPAQSMVKRYSAVLPNDLVLVGLPRIHNYTTVATGAGITVGSESSTLGVPVSLGAGGRGYLTAGHGARSVGDHVLIGATTIGSVMYSSCRELSSAGSAVADVAVVALDPATAETPSGAPPITAAGLAPPNTLVSTRCRGNLRQGRIWALAPQLFPDMYSGWGEVILCSPISVPGDSGSAVLRDDDTSACIGHVVGGTEGYLTVVQQLQYQLDAARVVLRL
jgi:hypothetical protein